MRKSETAQRRQLAGLLLGVLGVLAFSLTLPMTRTAVAELSAWWVAFARIAGAGLLAALWLLLRGGPRPQASDARLVAASALGIVFGFPLLSSLAMTALPASQGAIATGALPFATALIAALWFGERHSRRFWICAAIGSALVVAFALREGGSGQALGWWAMLGAVLTGALGYAAGGRLAARIGGVHAILWALVVSLPLSVPMAVLLTWLHPPQAQPTAWAAFAYLTLVSQLLGFFAWYSALAIGGIGRIGQIQLLQVFFTIGFAALLFGEPFEVSTLAFAAAVVLTIVLGRRAPPPVRP